MVNRRPAQTRARIAQTASRLHSLIHPEAVAPDELLVSEPTGRIGRAPCSSSTFAVGAADELSIPSSATFGSTNCVRLSIRSDL